MSKNQVNKLFDELDQVYADDHASAPGRTTKKRQSRRQEMDARVFVRAQEAAGEFKFTYKAARFEEAWLLDSLYEIAGQQLISDVLRKVKAGKEQNDGQRLVRQHEPLQDLPDQRVVTLEYLEPVSLDTLGDHNTGILLHNPFARVWYFHDKKKA